MNAIQLRAALVFVLLTAIGCGPAQLDSSSLENFQDSVTTMEKGLEPDALRSFREDIEVVLQRIGYAQLGGLDLEQIHVKAVDIRRQDAKRASDECQRSCSSGTIHAKVKRLTTDLNALARSVAADEERARDRRSELTRLTELQKADADLYSELKAKASPDVDEYRRLRLRSESRRKAILQMSDLARECGGARQEILISKVDSLSEQLGEDLGKLETSLAGFAEEDLGPMPSLVEARTTLEQQQMEAEKRSAAISALKDQVVQIDGEVTQSANARTALIGDINRLIPEVAAAETLAKDVADLLASSPYLLRDHEQRLSNIVATSQSLRSDVEKAAAAFEALKDRWLLGRQTKENGWKGMELPFFIGPRVYSEHYVDDLGGVSAADICSSLMSDVDAIEVAGFEAVSLSDVGKVATKKSAINAALTIADETLENLIKTTEQAPADLTAAQQAIDALSTEASRRKKKLDKLLIVGEFERSEQVDALVASYGELLAKLAEQGRVIEDLSDVVSAVSDSALEFRTSHWSLIAKLWEKAASKTEWAVARSVAHQVARVMEEKGLDQLSDNESLQWFKAMAEFIFPLSYGNYVTAGIEVAPRKVEKLKDRETLRAGRSLVAASVSVEWDWEAWRADVFAPLESIVARHAVGSQVLVDNERDDYTVPALPSEFTDAGYRPLFFLAGDRATAYYCHPSFVEEINNRRNIWVVNSGYRCALIHEAGDESKYCAIPQLGEPGYLGLPVASVAVRDGRRRYESSVILADAVTRTRFISSSIKIDLRRRYSPGDRFAPKGSQDVIGFRYYCPDGLNFKAASLAFEAGIRGESLTDDDLSNAVLRVIGGTNAALDREWSDAYSLHKLTGDD